MACVHVLSSCFNFVLCGCRERERVVGGGEMREYVCERRVREERRMSTHTYRGGSRQGATRAKNKQTLLQ